jgi:hypothetical protein
MTRDGLEATRISFASTGCRPALSGFLLAAGGGSHRHHTLRFSILGSHTAFDVFAAKLVPWGVSGFLSCPCQSQAVFFVPIAHPGLVTMASCHELYCDAAHKENMDDFAFEEMFVRSSAGRL